MLLVLLKADQGKQRRNSELGALRKALESAAVPEIEDKEPGVVT